MAQQGAEEQPAGEEMYEGQEELEYEEEIPVGEGAEAMVDGADGQAGDATDLEAMKAKLQAMEEEAARLRALQAGGGEGAAGAAAAAAAAAAEAASKEEADSRSIYVGNVDYSCTPEELQQHFQSCGTVNRVTILTDKFGNPKGFAYVEFLEVDAVSNAILLDNTELRGRNIKVVQKRTNVPGMKARGRGRGRGGGRFAAGYGFAPFPGFFGMPFMPQPFAPRGRGGYGGFAPRGRGRGGRGGNFYSPY